LFIALVARFRFVSLSLSAVSDYAGAFSQGFVHRKHKPKIAAQFSGFLFLSAYQNKF
jgi:hypothetical protein